jgi:SagB-type dehydrogenase family enzyme
MPKVNLDKTDMDYIGENLRTKIREEDSVTALLHSIGTAGLLNHRRVENLEKNVYRYQPSGHRLVKTLEGDCRSQLASAYLGPYYVKGGALYFLFTASIRAGGDWAKYAHMEVGHAAQNVYLQAAALGLGTVVNGGFDADRARAILNLPESETPLYFMPVGRLVSP